MATTLGAQFHEKYGLSGVNRDWFESPSEEEREVKAQRIVSGKTQNVWTDVIKRFFRNKWNVISTFIFLGLILIIIIAPHFSQFGEFQKVSDASTQRIMLLKPSSAPNWRQVTTTVPWGDYYNDLNNGQLRLVGAYGIYVTGPNFNIVGTPIRSGDSITITYNNIFAVPTYLGTDSIGQDVWTRLWVGAGWSLKLAFLVATIETVIGVSFGIYVGVNFGKKVDTFFMRGVELFNSVPSLLWMLVFALIIGTGFWSMALVLILVGWTGPIYTARTYTIRIKDAEFVKAAEASGVSPTGRLFKHILPNILGRLLVLFVQRIPSVIYFETTLRFLGLSVGSPDQATIGNLLSDASQINVINNNIAYVLSISIFLVTLTIAMQAMANGIRDAFDPKIGA